MLRGYVSSGGLLGQGPHGRQRLLPGLLVAGRRQQAGVPFQAVAHELEHRAVQAGLKSWNW
jgi:hypothetical protein